MFQQWLTVILFCLALTACGSSLEGTYTGADTFLDQIEIKEDNKVELTFMGSIKEGVYEVENGNLRINNQGDITILRITDAGCLEGDGLLGTYCKGDRKPGQNGAESKPAQQAGTEYIGSRFAAGPAGDEWILDFVNDRTVRMEIDGDVENLEYSVRGKNIVISGLDGTDLVLTQRGQDLEGGPDGMILVFKKRS